MTELETMKRAKMYMDKLARGIDPILGTEIPEDSVLNNVRLVRCFLYVSDVLQRVIDNGGVVERKPRKADFMLTQQQIEQIPVSTYPLRISEFVDVVYKTAGNNEMKKPGTTLITNWLLSKGFLEKVVDADGRTCRVPTEAGKGIGMYTETRQGQYGEYTAVYYNTNAQKFLIDHLGAILRERNKQPNQDTAEYPES